MENLTASIISCMELQEAGVKHIIAKAGDKHHRQILQKLNIDEVVFPRICWRNYSSKYN